MEDERAVGENSQDRPQTGLVRRWLIQLGVLVVVFLLGLVPMWWSKRTAVHELDRVNRELRRSQLQNTLSSAVVYARRGEYETGRLDASSFFTEVQAELGNTNSNVLSVNEKSQIQSLMAGRDDIITLLSRGDPASADRLSDLYVSYRTITGKYTQK